MLYIYYYFHAQEINTSMITGGDDGGLNDSDVEEEPELPIGVSIESLRKVFKVSSCDIIISNTFTCLVGKTQLMEHDTPWTQGFFHSSHNLVG